MATQVQRRRGTTTEHSTFTGAEGELTVDTTKDTVVVHDGATAGGQPLAREDLDNVSSADVTAKVSAATTSAAGKVQLEDSTTSTSTTTAATPNSVKVAKDAADAAQTTADAALPAAGGTITNDLTIEGDLTVNGTTTTIDTETLLVKDKNIEMGVVDTPTDITANGGGITLKGTTDKTINWVDSTDSWTSSENIDLASGKTYKIAGTDVLSATALGSNVQISSANIPDGTVTNADLAGSIADSKLNTISTAGKVSNSATTATAANTSSAIVARDADGNFSAGTITADLDGNASTVTTNANLTGDVTSVGNATSIAAGVIVDADVNASAAIAGTKISPDFGSQTVQTSGVFSAAGGAEATPSIAFTGDLNTGIYSPGADQVAISTGGTGRLFVDASGRVGLGNTPATWYLDQTAPSNTLARFSTSATGAAFIRITSADSYDSGIQFGGSTSPFHQQIVANDSDKAIRFITNASERLRLTSTGEFTFKGAGTAGTTQAVYFSGSAPVDSLVVDSNGRVGLGASSPDTEFQITSDPGPTITLDTFGNTAGELIGAINFNNRTSAPSDEVLAFIKAELTDTRRRGSLALGTGNNAAATTKLFIDHDGLVGIGTASPQTELTVRGSTPQITFEPTSDAQDCRLQFALTDGTVQSTIRGGGLLGTAITFNDGPTFAERARIDSSGRLLVGTSTYTGPTRFVVRGNSSSDNGAGGIYAVRGETSSEMSDTDVIGFLRFADEGDNRTAEIRSVIDGTPSATASPGALSFWTTQTGLTSPTERMRIESNGKLNITSGNTIYASTGTRCGIFFSTSTAWMPTDNTGTASDNSVSLGTASIRMSEIFAGTGTINTSDATLKQDVENLDAAELTVATAIKGLIKKYRFTDAVNAKGDDARIHVGVIAQEVEQAFLDAGLDASRYALFCRDTWYEVDDSLFDSEGNKVTADTPGAVEKTRLGIRYSELLAFVIAAM